MADRFLDLQQVLQQLSRDVEKAGGQSEWARRSGVDRATLNRVMTGKRSPNQQIIRALKLKKFKLPNDILVGLLHQDVRRAGGQSEWARRKGISRVSLNYVINGKRPFNRRIIEALKLSRDVEYVSAETLGGDGILCHGESLTREP